MFLPFLRHRFSSKHIPQQNPSIYKFKNKLKWKIKAKLKG